MFGLLRGLTLGRVVLFLILWFFVLSPLIFGTYNRLVGYYWWMRP